MRKPLLGRALWLGWLLSLLLTACGSDSQNNQSRQPLRLTLRFETGYVDEPYTATLTADGGVRPYRFTLEGNLPKGLVYANGRISGTPQEKGTFELTVSVEDANLSNRTQKVTLVIGETPPPRLDQVFPLAEVSDPFPYLFRVREREARGFQVQIPLKDLRMTLDSFKADASLLYVLRYDEEKGLLDIDAVFTSPRKDLEAFRFIAAPRPDQKVRPEASFRGARVAFYDKNGKLASNAQAIERTPSQGRYSFGDLEAMARNWGRRLTLTNPSAAAPQAPANDSAQGQASSTSPSTENQVAGATQGSSPAAPPAEQTPSEAAQPTQPGPAQPTLPGQERPTQLGQAQPQSRSALSGQKLEGDLNGDGVVDQKDLDLLRSSYAWASVGAGPAAPPANRASPAGETSRGSGASGVGSGNTNPENEENPDNPEGK